MIRSNQVEKSQGAVQSRTTFGDKLSSWWIHHHTSFLGAFSRLIATPVQTLMTSLVVAIALALPATLFVALSNIQELGDNWDAQPKISAYLNVRAREAAILSFIDEVKRMPDVARVEHLSPAKALEDFQKYSGFGEVLSGLDENPLPATVIITPKSSLQPHELKRLGEQIAKNPIVDEASLDMEWVKRLRELMVLGKKIVVALASLLGLGVLLAVGNTIRLAIENRRDEIVVVKLVGGTDAFVRRPFIYAGAWYGFFGGVIASIIVAVGFFTLSDTVGRLAFLYQSDFSLQGLSFGQNLQLLLVSTLLGWAGARLAVGRHLASIEPK
ncbi:permease-like cell division protein FtsX [Teredinibacter sp. KSP-S5-2]|uniref:permease-like cell division protein FtsX n=1 Tax=Teredinibacter sp. KSP-S5-2 TaxID=3034506 RepID=UPI00293412A6|nr:permease-like cell division protein FtsX [Teredinibacter sp. KSP-S5-2]WNO08996.1 permease-like cell division protein FtsX [Teredinibacter sp. KSP-S5-2]